MTENGYKRWLTRNIAKSGEVIKRSSFSPFKLHLRLKENHSQIASCHIATDMHYQNAQQYINHLNVHR